MAYYKQTVLLNKQLGTGYSSSPITLSNSYNIQVETGKADKKDVFKFNIVNANNKYFNGENSIEVGDQVRVYFYKNKSTYTSDDIQIDGTVTEVPFKANSKGRILTVKGYSRIDMMFQALVFVNINNDTTSDQSKTYTLPEAIANIVGKVNDANNLTAEEDSKKIKFVYYDTDVGKYLDHNGDERTADEVTISRVNSEGTAFSEAVTVREIYRKAIELIKKYSSDEYTNDGAYEYKLSSDNYFYWGPKNETVNTTTLTEGTQPTEIDIKKSKDDIVNTLIINVGKSPSNRGNTVFVTDSSSLTKHGARWRYISKYQNLTEGLMTNEESANRDSFDVNVDRFPSAYPYTTYFKSSADFDASPINNSPAATKGSSITVANDAEYDAVLRREAEEQGRKWGIGLLKLWANPRYEADVVVSNTDNFTTTELIAHTIKSYNFDQKNLRLNFINNSIWKSELKSLEDEEDAI